MAHENRPQSAGAHEETVRRACLPEVLFRPDIALALQIPEEDADALILSGQCGPYIRIGGRLAVRRASFLAALREQERHVLPPIEDDTDLAGGAP